jgi:predicted alpha/beta-hydrolase family hydrolase
VKAQDFDFRVGGGAAGSALLYSAEKAGATLVLAHGAGGRQTHPWMIRTAHALLGRGFDVVTFDFLYSHAGRRVPDRNDVLDATWRAVAEAVRERQGRQRPLFVGGKSMGGRIATQVAAQSGFGDIAGLVLLGYPLHPPGKPERLRAAHLPKVRSPMLFVQGSRDGFGTPDELRPIVESLPAAELFVVEGGDHSLVTPKGSETVDEVTLRVAEEVDRFVAHAIASPQSERVSGQPASTNSRSPERAR